MNVVLEENFRLNGVESPIHCIEFDFKESFKIQYHYHGYIEILFFLDGEGLVWVNGRSNQYTKNTLIIVNSQRAHAIDIIKPSKYICIKVMPDILYANELSFAEFKYALPFISEVQNEYFFTSKDTDEMKISDLISDIMLEWNTMNYCFEMELRSKLLEFFTRILRHLYSNGFISEVGTIRPEVKKAIVYVTDNYSTVSEKELARICHLSYNYFSYLFKKTIGKSFKDYLLDIKIFQAEKMLLSTEKSITDIAQETGFSTTSHFISQFKKKNGITPAKFKKEFTGNEQARS